MKTKTVYELTDELLTNAIEKKMEGWVLNVPFSLFAEFGKRFNDKGTFSGYVLTGEGTDKVSLGVDYKLPERTICSHVEIQSVKTKNGLQRGFKGTVAMRGHEYPLGLFSSLSDLAEKAIDRMCAGDGSAFDALDYFEDTVGDYAKSINYPCHVEYTTIIGDADMIYARYKVLRRDLPIFGGRISFTRSDGQWVCCIEFDEDEDYVAIGKDKDLKMAIRAACGDKRMKE